MWVLWQDIDWNCLTRAEGKVHLVEMCISRCYPSPFFRPPRRTVTPIFPLVSSRNCQWKQSALGFALTMFNCFLIWEIQVTGTGECHSGGRWPSSLTTPPAFIYYHLQVWKSSSEYASLTSSTTSEKSFTKYSL